MDKLVYYGLRAVAIMLACVLTGYGAWLSWCHFQTILGPLVAISAAALLVIAEHAWLHSRRRALLLGFLGAAAAVFSATVVIDRITATDAARVQGARNANHPRVEAQRALDDAKVELATAAAEAAAECRSGRKKRCLSLEEREAAARQRVETARAKVIAAGAQAHEDPAAALFGAWAETYRVALPLALPMWLEIAAPALMAYGLAPLHRNAPQSLQPAQPQRSPQRRRATPRNRSKRGRSYWLARIERARPDLAKLIRNGEMSVNMAAIKAGFRKQHLKIVAHDPKRRA
jgi:hypothetical protein